MHPHKILKPRLPKTARGTMTLLVMAGWMAAFALLAGCQSSPRSLTVMTHDSFAVSEDVLKEFERENGVTVSILLSGDAGEALNKTILTKQSPLADVLYGVDNTFLSRALEEGIFTRYDSPLLEGIPAQFRMDPGNRALPVDYADVCINYDRGYFRDHALPVPDSLEDLANPQYRGLLAVENPATSSPGLAFLLATIRHFGPEGFGDYWVSLKENGVEVADGWTTAYYTDFSGSSGDGPQAMVVSYGSSPAAEMIFADPVPSEPPTASLTGPDMCFRQVEFAGILAGTPNRDLAEKFVDFLLGLPFQEDMPLQMFVYPVNPDAGLPAAFVQYAQVPEAPASLLPADIAAHREEWIAEWERAVFR
jgi:thiamine transport system substrate-binding protein